MVMGRGYGTPATGRARTRAGTADREQAVELLKTAYADGRLTGEEYDARLGHALTAATYGDLDRLVADLPGARPFAARPRLNGLAVASLACGAGQFAFGPLTTIPAIVLGHVASRQIKRTGETGAALATAGLMLGYAGAALMVLLLLFIAAVIAHH